MVKTKMAAPEPPAWSFEAIVLQVTTRCRSPVKLTNLLYPAEAT